MVFRNSLKSILRAPAKSLLLLLLAAAVTAFTCLGVGMRRSAGQLRQEADEVFRTTAVLEYVGKYYPDMETDDSEMIAALAAFDLVPLTGRPEVLSYDTQLTFGGCIPGLTVSAAGERSYQDAGVILFKVSYDTDGELRCLILDTLYASPDYKPGLFFTWKLTEEMRTALENTGSPPGKGCIYLAAGFFSYDPGRTLRFTVQPFENAAIPDDPALKTLLAAPIVDLTGLNPESYGTAAGYDGLQKVAEACRILNNRVAVSAADDPESFLCFQEQETHLTSGRFLTAEDRGQPVCLVSDYLCRQMGYSLGDTVELDLFGAIGTAPLAQCWWPDTGYLRQGEYRIVGTFKETTGLTYQVFIPRDESWMPAGGLSSTICRFRLSNAGAAAWQAAVKPYLLPEMQISVFDQGYADAVSALNAMRREANVLLAASGISALAILLLLAYLLVMKQRREVRVMLALGTGRTRTIGYLLLCALLLTLAAVILGGTAGNLASGRVMDDAYARALSGRVGDSRYSNSAVVGERLAFHVRLQALPQDALTAAAAVLGTSLLLTGAFACAVTRDRALRRQPSSGKGAQMQNAAADAADSKDTDCAVLETETLKCGPPEEKNWICRAAFPARMALRAIRRSGAKNLTAAATSLCMALLIGAFSAGIAADRAEREAVYDTLPVVAYLTNYNGKQINNLYMPDTVIQQIEDMGFAAQTNLSRELHCQLLGPVRHADGTPAPDPGAPDIPVSGFAAETFDDSISGMDKLVFTTSLRYAPAYFFEEDVPFTFFNGYDESAFAGEEAVCAASQEYLDVHGLCLGDVIRLTALQRNRVNAALGAEFGVLEAKIVAVCPKLQGGETVYVSLAAAAPVQQLLDWHYSNGVAVTTIVYYDAASFVLKDVRNLSVFKDKLEQAGISPVGKIGAARINLVVRDQKLYDTLNSLTRHIGYLQALSAGTFALSVAMGFVISYLLTRTRKPELAILRSTGAGPGKAFAVFFIEQGALCLIGAAAGLLLIRAGLFGNLPVGLSGIALYAVCYLAGIAAAIRMMERDSILMILGTGE